MTINDYEIGSRALRAAGFTVPAPAVPAVNVEIPHTLRNAASRVGARIVCEAGFGYARCRVVLPAGGGIIEVKGADPPRIVAEIRDIVGSLGAQT